MPEHCASVFSHAASMALGMAMSVCGSAHLVKCLENYQTHCHEILHRCSWTPMSPNAFWILWLFPWCHLQIKVQFILWNISTSGWICTDIHGSKRMNPKDFGNALTFPLAPPARKEISRYPLSSAATVHLCASVIHCHIWANLSFSGTNSSTVAFTWDSLVSPHIPDTRNVHT